MTSVSGDSYQRAPSNSQASTTVPVTKTAEGTAGTNKTGDTGTGTKPTPTTQPTNSSNDPVGDKIYNRCKGNGMSDQEADNITNVCRILGIGEYGDQRSHKGK